MTTTIDIKRLRELQAAATPAPWNNHYNRRKVYQKASFPVSFNSSERVRDVALFDEFADADFTVAVRNALPALLDRLEELEGIVEKLPKTADGVPVVPGMRVWVRFNGKILGTTLTENIYSDAAGSHSLWFASRAAAEEGAKQ